MSKMQVRGMKILLRGNLEFFIIRYLLCLPLLECGNDCRLGCDAVWFGRSVLTFLDKSLAFVIKEKMFMKSRHLITVGVQPSSHTSIVDALLLRSDIDISNWRWEITRI